MEKKEESVKAAFPGRSGNAFQDFCTMLGLMTVTWAWAENALAMTIGVINEHAGPIKGNPEAPIALKKRIQCLRTALRDIPALKPLQERGRLLTECFVQLGARRHDLVHGSAFQIAEGGFQATLIKVIAGNYSVKNHGLNITDTIELNVEIAKLSDESVAFLLAVCDTFKTQ